MAVTLKMERLIHLCPVMLVLALTLVGASCQSEKPAILETAAQTSEASTAPSPTPATSAQTPISTAIPSPTPGQPGINGNTTTEVYDQDEFPCGPIAFGSPLNLSDSFVFWTLDSSQLVFSIALGTIWIVGADGSHLNKVLDANPEPVAFGVPGFLYGFHGDLSPDGTQIVYTSCQFPFLHSYTGETEPTRDGPELYDRGRYNYEIAISGLDGSNQQRLTSNERLDTIPVWSPDGSRIAFTSNDALYSPTGVINSQTLYLMMADGSNVQSIPLQFDVYGLAPPMWSPDGGRLAVVLNEQNGQMAIYTVQSDGSESVKVAELGNHLTTWKPVAAPTWSPDSKRVAFTTFDGEEWSVYAARFDGTDLRRIWSSGTGEEAIAATQVSWSPDGSEILFVADDVHLVGVDGDGLRTLISGSAESTKAAWSPDGSMIAVYNPRRSSSIPVVPLEWEGTRYDNIMLATLSRDGTDLRVLVEYDPDLEPRLVQPTRPEATTEPATGSPTPIPAEPAATLGEP